MSDLKQQFEQAAESVQKLPSRPSDEDLLILYGLYKQATQGDVSGKRPSLFDFKGAAKYRAWEEIKGMAPEQAMKDYIEFAQQLIDETT